MQMFISLISVSNTLSSWQCRWKRNWMNQEDQYDCVTKSKLYPLSISICIYAGCNVDSIEKWPPSWLTLKVHVGCLFCQNPPVIFFCHKSYVWIKQALKIPHSRAIDKRERNREKERTIDRISKLKRIKVELKKWQLKDWQSKKLYLEIQAEH